MKRWPLVGRGEELELIVDSLRDEGRSVVIGGLAGVGKTRLAREVSFVLEAEGWTTATVVGSATAEAIPFAAVAGLVPDLEGAETPLAILAAARRSLSGDEHRLLLVDDGHRLDGGSATLIQQVVADRVCPTLVTVRSGEPTPDAIVALWKDGWANRVEIQALSRHEVGELVEAVLEGPVDSTTERALWDASRGNALYLRELVLEALEHQQFEFEAGVWRLQGRPAVPAALLELIGSRLAAVDPAARDGLELLAPASSLEVVQLEALAPGALDRLERSSVVEVDPVPPPTVALAHPLYGEAVRTTLTQGRRRQLCRRLADELERAGKPEGPTLLRAVTWRLEAGEPQDADRLSAAARQAYRANDFTLAVQLAQAAVGAGAGFDAGLLLGEIAMLSYRGEEAENRFAGIGPLADTDEDRSRLAKARAHNLWNQLGRPAEAEAVLKEALPHVRDPAHAARLRVSLGQQQAVCGRPADAVETVGPLFADPTTEIPLDVAGTATYALGFGLALLGRVDEVLMVRADFGRRLGEDTLAHHSMLGIEVPSVVALASAGRFDEADALVTSSLDAGLTVGNLESNATYTLLGGALAFERGRVQGSRACFQECLSANRELRDWTAVRWALGGLALAQAFGAATGDPADPIAELDQIEGGRFPVFELSLIERGRAWSAAAAGERTRAAAIQAEAAAAAEAAGLPAVEITLRHDRARLGHARTETDRIGALAQEVHGELPATRAAHATALADDDADALEDVARRFATIGASVLAQEAALAAAGRFRTDGLSRRASACLELARGAAAGSEGAVSPAADRIEGPTPLTAREREIAELAARGQSSAQIAATLYLSRRTVDNHLQKIYIKLGVSGRAELPAALGRP